MTVSPQTLRLLTVAPAMVAICGVLPAYAAAPNMKPGLWEITITMRMPAGAGPPHRLQQCFSAEDIANLRGAPGPTRLDRPCQTSDYKIKNGIATWEMICTGAISMSGSGRLSYLGTSYSGTTTLTVDNGGRPQTMTTIYSGQYLGACAHP